MLQPLAGPHPLVGSSKPMSSQRPQDEDVGEDKVQGQDGSCNVGDLETLRIRVAGRFLRIIMQLDVEYQARVDVQCRRRPPRQRRNKLRGALQRPLVAVPLAEHGVGTNPGALDGEVHTIAQGIGLSFQQLQQLIRQALPHTLVLHVLVEGAELHLGMSVEGQELPPHVLRLWHMSLAVFPQRELKATVLYISLGSRHRRQEMRSHVLALADFSLVDHPREEPGGRCLRVRLCLARAKDQKVLLPIRFEPESRVPKDCLGLLLLNTIMFGP